MLLNADRYYPTKTLVKYGVVVHDSESGDGSSATLVNLLQQPGDRISARGSVYGAGYHAVTDGKGGYVQVADASAGPYAAPPLNPTWWHVCMPGRAIQTRAEWLDELSYAHIRGVAKFIMDKWNEDGRSWPLQFVSYINLKNGQRGYTSHAQVSLAWHETDHTDPGGTYPWDVLTQEIQKLIQPSEDDEMSNVRFVRHTGFINVFMIGAGPALSVPQEVIDTYPPDTPKIFFKEANYPALKALCFQAGLDRNNPSELVPGGSLTAFS